ncbi:MAG: hypothetical protein EOO13_04600 [Chitinophagaceae bacterium]|nr:MAG: hypothetical protein EOO13_04600 [Chitinophagaceae bacterium]
MKKLTAAMAALALYFSASAFGPEPGNDLNALLNPSSAKTGKTVRVGKFISSAFNDQFANATTVSWRESQGLYLGYFKQKEEDYMVAYTPEGSLFAIARQLNLADLPEAISKTIAEKYSDCSLSPLASEVTIEGVKGYYLTVENKTSTRLIKFYEEGQDELVKRTKKKVLVGSVM